MVVHSVKGESKIIFHGILVLKYRIPDQDAVVVSFGVPGVFLQAPPGVIIPQNGIDLQAITFQMPLKLKEDP